MVHRSPDDPTGGMTDKQAPMTKIRDAARSREEILDAAERLFADHGFDGVSLNDIALAAGLSRGTPSYFFGSKRQLYRAVLERVFQAREEATSEAFAPLVRWSAAEETEPLARTLGIAVDRYLRFLLERPSFAKLVQHEELVGARLLRETPRESRAVWDAFQALRAVARRRGLRPFDVADAVLVFVSLSFSPLTQRSTFMAALGRDLEDPKTRRHHVELVVGQLLALLER